MVRVFFFSELEDSAKQVARERLHDNLERLPWQAAAIRNTLPDIAESGILIDEQDVCVAPDGYVSFTAKEVTLDIVLARSGVGKKYLGHPGYYDLFCVNCQALVKRVRPFSDVTRMISVSVEFAPFENNDGGKAFLACEIAAGLLEQYLKHLVATISDSLRRTVEEERARIFSPSFLDAYLEGQGKVFGKTGDRILPMNAAEEGT